MQVDGETVPILCMCRLCLNYSQDCSDIGNDQSNLTIRNKIRKYLYIEINDDDSLPRTICQQCINRIEVFDQFCQEVTHHQELICSKLKPSSNETQIITTPTNLIQLSPAIVSKTNGTFIITLQTSTSSEHVLNTRVEDANENDIIISKLIKDDNAHETDLSSTHYEVMEESSEIYTSVLSSKQNVYAKTSSTVQILDECPMQINSISIERELDELDEITADSDNEYNEDNDEHVVDENATATIDDVDHEKFKDFPKLIEDSKLLYKGRDLLNMISKFYRLECDQCDNEERTVFQNLSDLCQHYVDVHQIKGYVVCCSMKLIKPRAMALHMARHLQPDAFKCPECNKMLTCPKILQYHMQNHLPESQRPLACSQCPRRFSYSSALVAHAISHQPESQRAAHVCDECGKVFVSAGRLTTHINVTHMQHGQDYTCNICGKRFACRSNLSYHLTTHEPKVRQVQCSKCGKWLKNKLCLSKHMVQHSSIRYSCSMCDYSAVNRQCLRNHMRVQHTNDKPFACGDCGKAFKLKNTLQNHQVQHTGVRRFVCPFCSRSFASSGNYYSHRKRMHPQELAAMKLKQEEQERKLREQIQKSTDRS
ncbi:zinc finger protein 69 homolog [Sitodiplosis mosellana]|uniref:zinc finger protein 69 homolog n=1 Tax=Sitodiplosis mosellana TaxID=263140 RepID=UPI002445022F|nr:zinc finger protein 69 homolog [Sitodiplosis mosellana]